MKLFLCCDGLQLKAFLKYRMISKIAFIQVPRPRIPWNQRHSLKIYRINFLYGGCSSHTFTAFFTLASMEMSHLIF